MDRKVIIGFLIALIAIIVVGFIAMNFVPTNDIINLNVTDNMTDMAENATLNLSQDLIDEELNITPNETDVDDLNDTNSSDAADPGDVLHKQTFTISKNQTGPNAGMEPGTYVMYYTENDGPIKIQKVN